MKRADKKIDLIASTLEGDVLNKKVFALLQDLRKISQSLEPGQKSEFTSASVPLGECRINRAEFDAWRADYWRNRAGTWGQ
jgi:hypothetical protein